MKNLGRPDVPSRRFVVRASVLALAGALALTGCGSDKKEPKAEPSATRSTSSVNVPSGVTLTEAGTDLKFGQTATVAYEPNPERNSVLELTVKSAQQGSIADLGSYVLDDRAKASTPYYVRVGVKNVGDGDVGQTPIPLWAVDKNNTLIQASSFTNAFTKCPSTPLPTTFAPNAVAETCLVYLVPDHGTLTGVSFRPLQAVAPIVWTGPVTPATVAKKKKAS
ncbi:hypothetical protein [Marmoricola sp. RAF53]|uniref:hypothetical protein n=1 Tax=Marmoricola sp. RAF53 TaxID=3233059 RepID=UPI003F97F52B